MQWGNPNPGAFHRGDRIVDQGVHILFDHQRFLLQLSVGAMPHHQVLHAIELLGTSVAPVVRDEIARRNA